MKKNHLIKNYFYNMLYQLLIILAPLITTPYVSRVLGATNIGIYQYTQSIANYFVLIGAVGTTLYGQREIAYNQENPKERSKVFWEIEVFRIITTLICSIIFIIVFYRHDKYSQIFAILTIEVIAEAIDISWLYIGMENFKLIVLRNTIIKTIGIICVFAFVKDQNDLPIYAISLTAPIFLGNLSLWFSVNRYLVKTNIKVTGLLIGIKKRLRSIIVMFIPQIAMDVYLLLDKTMIGLIGSSIDQVGYYSQGQKIVKIVLLIVTSLGTVMLPAMSAYHAQGNREKIEKSIIIVFRFIYMLSFALLFGLCAIAPRFVPIFFGDGYEPVVNLMIIISPILVIIATSNVVGKQYLLPTNQQGIFTKSILTGAVVNFFLNLIFIRLWDATGASISTVIAELAVTLVQCWSVRRQIPLRECLTPGIRYALYGTIMFCFCRLISSILPEGKIWPLFVIIFAGVGIYACEILVTRDPIIRIGYDLLMKKS